jgi:serine/threonine protein kinase
MSKSQHILNKESTILQSITEYQIKGYPDYLSSGKTQKVSKNTQTSYDYLIMTKLGMNLKEVMKSLNVKQLELKTVVQIGIQIIDRLQALHELGYIYCDLKLDNIMIGSKSYNSLESSKIYLVDLGVAMPYLNNENLHLRCDEKKIFTGNILFASKNAFAYKQQSRRDDLIALVYLLIYLLNKRELVFTKDLKANMVNYF